MKFLKDLFTFSDYSYDRYDEKPGHQKNFIEQWWTNLLNKLGVRRSVYDEEYVTFDFAGVQWNGYADGAVSPHPTCPACSTQLSFTSRDTVMCDHCHKYKKNLGDFTFQIEENTISFDAAFKGAEGKWATLKHEYFED